MTKEQTTSNPNPVMRRIQDMEESWTEFTEEEEARLLRFLIPHDSGQMIDAFIQMQYEEASESPDLFVELRPVFQDRELYSLSLQQAFIQQYQDNREFLAQDGIESNWNPPKPDPDNTSMENFIELLLSFEDYYEEEFMNLAIVLRPISIQSIPQWKEWLSDLLSYDFSQHLRFLIFDSVESPQLDDLQEEEDEMMITDTPNLEKGELYQEIARESGDGGPDSIFRCHLLEVMEASEKQDWASAQIAAQKAIRIAQQQNWLLLEATVHITLGATYFSCSQIPQAKKNYEKAEELAQKAKESGDESGLKIQIQSCLAQGSVWMSESQWNGAIEIYKRASTLAEEGEDIQNQIESLRLVSYCHEQTKQFQEAWETGIQSLELGEGLGEDVPTLPFLGKGLLRIASRPLSKYRSERPALKIRLEKLLGENWEEGVPA